VYLPPHGNLWEELQVVSGRPPSSSTGSPQLDPSSGTLREYGLGAQVLRDLGVRRIQLLTNNPRKIAGIRGFGLVVDKSVPLVSMHKEG
jgi:3,4-dihydroxy 2-butanone 4-phosphate synthase / GTP cyclohydrolase II